MACLYVTLKIARRNKTQLVIFLMLLFLVPQKEVLGQNEASENYLWFDQLIGPTNSGVFKGVRYANAFRTINEKHQFFKSTDFRTGSVTFFGQRYFELPLQYDVFLDQLLVMNTNLPNRPIMVFDRFGVTRFTIDGHVFELLSEEVTDTELRGFFEVLLQEQQLTLYKKHLKKPFKRTDAQNLYYEFKDGYMYVLLTEGTYSTFKKVGELAKIFPSYKKELRTILKKHVDLRKSGSDDYVMAVLNDFLPLISTPKKAAL